MDDILLTPNEVKTVVERVAHETPGSVPPARYLDIQREALIRAQVRKVVEWMNDRVDYDVTHMDNGDACLPAGDWATLRAAAEEGRGA
jgi:hypothetical protein